MPSLLGSSSVSSDVQRRFCFSSPKCQTQPALLPPSLEFHDFMYQLNLLVYTQGHRHKFNPQGQKCIVYHFAPLFWLLNYPDLALHQLRPHIKRKLRRQKLLSSRAECCAIACAWFIILPSHGSDLFLRTGDGSRRFGCGGS